MISLVTYLTSIVRVSNTKSTVQPKNSCSPSSKALDRRNFATFIFFIFDDDVITLCNWIFAACPRIHTGGDIHTWWQCVLYQLAESFSSLHLSVDLVSCSQIMGNGAIHGARASLAKKNRKKKGKDASPSMGGNTCMNSTSVGAHAWTGNTLQSSTNFDTTNVRLLRYCKLYSARSNHYI